MQNMLTFVDNVGSIRAFFDVKGNSIENISLHDDKGAMPIEEKKLFHVRQLIQDYYLQSIAEIVIDGNHNKLLS